MNMDLCNPNAAGMSARRGDERGANAARQEKMRTDQFLRKGDLGGGPVELVLELDHALLLCEAVAVLFRAAHVVDAGLVERGLVLEDREHPAQLLDPRIPVEVLLQRIRREGRFRSLDLQQPRAGRSDRLREVLRDLDVDDGSGRHLEIWGKK